MEKTLYLECNRGISGDMFVAALLDLGVDAKLLEETLASLQVTGAKVQISRVKKAGLDVCDFEVVLDEAHENRDHDMGYLYGKHVERSKDGQEEGDHAHTSLLDVMAIIRRGKLSKGATALAEKIFWILAEAEAKAHGVSVKEVHFHEVGAVDSILDIVAAAICMDNLRIKRVIIPQICEGRGTVRCRHGVLPVPVPAVVNIAEAYGLSIHQMEETGEFITPTGAAIAAAVCTDRMLPERFVIRKTGMGAGKRSYDTPSILRAFLIEEVIESQTDRICQLESNIDDSTGENLGFVMERLLQAGAKDVSYLPVYMKKNRPAYQLQVLCDLAVVSAMEEIIFQETTTIGIRRLEVERTVLKRKVKTVQTIWGEMRIKVCHLPEGFRCYPEYEDVAAVSRRYKIPYPEVYQMILKECERCHEEL